MYRLQLGPMFLMALLCGIALIIGGFFAFNISRDQQRDYTAHTAGVVWPGAYEHDKVTRVDHRWLHRHYCNFSVHYEVAGTEYIAKGESRGYCGKDQKEGTSKQVFYNPSNPASSGLGNPKSLGAIFFPALLWIGGLLAAAIGAIGFFKITGSDDIGSPPTD